MWRQNTETAGENRGGTCRTAAEGSRSTTGKWLKCFCTAKETLVQVERKSTERQRISASYSSDRGSISRIYKELKRKKRIKNNDPFKKWAWDLNKEFSKDERKVAKKYLKKKKMFIISNNQGDANQNNLEVSSPPPRNSKNHQNNWQQMLQGVWEKEPLLGVDGIPNWSSHYENQCGEFSESNQ